MQSNFLSPLAACLIVLGVCGCSKEEAGEPAAQAESAEPETAAVSGRAALCDELKPAVQETLGLALTEVSVSDDEGFPLRCRYNPEIATAPWFEVADGVDLADSRRRYEEGGSETAEAPDLGPGAFTTTFSFMHCVVGAKGDKRIMVVGDQDFAQLEALWKRVADAV